MKHFRNRSSAEGHWIQVLIINNNKVDGQLANRSFSLENICKGGFRFVSDHGFELEDRLEIMLTFPDDYSQKVFGRICYIDEVDSERKAYGFSVLDGFYSFHASVA